MKPSVGAQQHGGDKVERFNGVTEWAMSLDRPHQALLHIHGSPVDQTNQMPIGFGQRKERLESCYSFFPLSQELWVSTQRVSHEPCPAAAQTHQRGHRRDPG
jgi:hypothetical protein